MSKVDAPTFDITAKGISATISAFGAELVRLQDEEGRDLLWNGNPAFWSGQSPILFPIVGRLKGDRCKVEGVAYPMRQHGVARISLFDLVAHDETSCRLRLVSNAKTRDAYPFDFSLDLVYRVEGATLTMTGEVTNTDHRPLPVAFGYHPAFNWPLPYGARREAHEILFERDEPGPLTPLAGGLLSSPPTPTPVKGRHLSLSDDLFRNDAMVFLDPQSRSLRYGPSSGRALRIDFPGMPQLGLWMKPGADYLCIEPWHGYASPEDFDGELAAKPGMTSLAPGATHAFPMRVTILEG